MRRLLLLLSLLTWLPKPSPAAELHKCLAADGQLSYQSQPCSAGARTLWVRDALPEATPPRPAARVASRPTPPAPRAKAVRTRATARDPQATRCAQAQRAAELRRDREWNRLDFRQRSELDASVARACAR
jgi:hypothetical protein